MLSFDFQPVIIIGAGRSGTNMLRDLLTALPCVATWPCDEINYIWRYGNARVPTDELTPSHASKQTVAYIRKQFVRRAKQTGARLIVEKTCANSLRVDFVRAIVPEAKFIFLVRDGRDVALSAEKRWQAPLDLGYLFKKALYVPTKDIPYYAMRYLAHRIHKVVSKNKSLPTWGPKCQQFASDWEKSSIRDVCLHQWHACVTRASEALARCPRSQVHYVRYEAFVNQPMEHLLRICEFLQINCEEKTLFRLGQTVHCGSVGKSANHRSSKDLGQLEEFVIETLVGVDRAWTDENVIQAA